MKQTNKQRNPKIGKKKERKDVTIRTIPARWIPCTYTDDQRIHRYTDDTVDTDEGFMQEV